MLNPLASIINIVPILLNGILNPLHPVELSLNSLGCVKPVGINIYPYPLPLNVRYEFVGLLVYPLLNNVVSPDVIDVPLNLPQYIFEDSGKGEFVGVGVGVVVGVEVTLQGSKVLDGVTVGVIVGVMVGVTVGVGVGVGVGGGTSNIKRQLPLNVNIV